MTLQIFLTQHHEVHCCDFYRFFYEFFFFCDHLFLFCFSTPNWNLLLAKIRLHGNISSVLWKLFKKHLNSSDEIRRSNTITASIVPNQFICFYIYITTKTTTNSPESQSMPLACIHLFHTIFSLCSGHEFSDSVLLGAKMYGCLWINVLVYFTFLSIASFSLSICKLSVTNKSAINLSESSTEKLMKFVSMLNS